MIDIIIPTYKNKQGLQRTLQSINIDLLSQFIITVIDDHSELNYDDIKLNFPFINLYILQKNVGPGMVRQFGLNNTHEPYVLFIDTEDVFYSFNVQIKMIKAIIDNPTTYLFSWQTYIENQKVRKDNHANLHGRIFKREFIQKYNITFSEKGSYANEDVGFIRFSKIALRLQSQKKCYLFFNKPLIIYTLNDNSITRENRKLFKYSSQNLGLAYNETHVIEMLVNNNFPIQVIQKEADIIMTSLYKNFYKTLQECPKYVQNSWDGAQYFYKNTYYKYENNKSENFQLNYSKLIQWHRENRHTWTESIPLNINKFLYELKNYKNLPAYYLTYMQDHDIMNK